MRVHLRNVVQTAIERGLVVGYHRVHKLSKPQQKNIDVVVDTMLQSVWSSLDDIIDFRDDDQESGDESQKRIGFGSVELIATESLAPQDEDKDDEDAVVPLNVLHRIHYRRHRRKP